MRPLADHGALELAEGACDLEQQFPRRCGRIDVLLVQVEDALDALVVGISTRRVNFIFDADVASFFDSVSKEWLVRFVEHRIGDKRIIRLIRKWLKSGVLEDGVVTVSEVGTGRGSVISPLLANIYMHYVFDLWVQRW